MELKKLTIDQLSSLTLEDFEKFSELELLELADRVLNTCTEEDAKQLTTAVKLFSEIFDIKT